MITFKVFAQSYTTSQQIKRTVTAKSEAAVLRMVSAALSNAGFYVTDIRQA